MTEKDHGEFSAVRPVRTPGLIFAVARHLATGDPQTAVSLRELYPHLFRNGNDEPALLDPIRIITSKIHYELWAGNNTTHLGPSMEVTGIFRGFVEGGNEIAAAPGPKVYANISAFRGGWDSYTPLDCIESVSFFVEPV